MMKKKQLKKRIFCSALPTLLSFGMLLGVPSLEAQASSERTPEQIYNDLMKSNRNMEAPSIYATDKDPYGYGVDVPFFLNQQNELVLYSTNSMTNKGEISFNSYDKLKSEHSGGVLDSATKNRTYTTKHVASKLNYVQMKAFDPTGSGRKDYIAMIGVMNKGGEGKNTLYLYVTSKDGSKWSTGLELGSVNWMGNTSSGDNDDSWLYNSMNFLSVTAGDYNGDGKDTLVVYGCYDNTGYGLNEISVTQNASDSGRLDLNSKSGSTHNKQLLHNIYKNNGRDSNLLGTNTWVDNHLGAKLDSGDINGDGIDDLVALSYVSRLTKSYSGRTQMTDMYRPYVAVSYGVAGGNYDYSARISKDMGIWQSINGYYNSCVAPGLSLGDVNNDGKKEVVVAGIYNRIEGTSGKNVSSPYNIDAGQIYVKILNDSLNLVKDAVVSSNTWTKDGFYASDDDVWQQTAVQCFHINGIGNAEMIFISGGLYALEGDNLSLKHTPTYFGGTDDNLGGGSTGYPTTSLTNTFIQSVAAGNFDGNDQGYEQVVYTIGLKTSGKENYRFTMGQLGGKKHDANTGLAAEYYSTNKDNIQSNYFPGGSENNAANLEDSYCLNYSICAVDNDNDGILARYKSKGYSYTDPEVMTVIQAAPYYEDMFDYLTDTNSTQYSISESFNYEQSKSTNVSFGIGVTAELSSPVIDMNVTAGYAMDWNKTFTEGLSESKTYYFDAAWKDQVVVKRVPITSYSYQVQDTKTGQWKEDEGIVLSFATAPTYMRMSINEYNGFVDYYNNKLKSTAGYNSLSAATKQKILLPKLSDSYLGHEGNPLEYMQKGQNDANVKILQTTPQLSTVGSGSSGFEWSSETSSGYSEETSHGFTYEGSLLMGAEVAGAGIKVGVTSSLESMSGTGVSKTTSYGKGISATVCDINTINLKAAANTVYDIEKAAQRYAFNWQIVQWPSNIRNNDGNQVPIFGYLISNVKTPSPMVNDFEASLDQDEDNFCINLNWSDPSLARNKVNKYNIYLRGKDDYGNVTRNKLATVDQGTLTYSYKVPTTGQTEFVFTVTTQNSEGVESVESEKVTVIMDMEKKTILKISKTETNGNVDTYTISYTDGTKSRFTVTNGIDGKDGKDGTDGKDGKDGVNGKSAYELAVEHGFTGTEEEWLTALAGANGTDGTNGLSAYEIAVQNGFTGTEEEWLAALAGANGTDGTNGLSAYEIAVKNGFVGTEAEWLESLKGSKEVVTVVSLEVSQTGDVICLMSDGTKKNFGKLPTVNQGNDDDDKDTIPSANISSLKKGFKAFTVKWNKVADIDGYEIRYSTKSSFAGSKTIKLKPSTNKKTFQSCKIKSLKRKKTYYVQIRTYIENEGTVEYSAWSKTRKVKTK